MQIFAIIGTRDNQRDSIIRLAKAKYTDANVFVAQDANFIAPDGETTQEVCIRLGIGDDENDYTAVVIAVQYYWGFHSPQLWEWITAKAKSNSRQWRHPSAWTATASTCNQRLAVQ